MMDLADQDRLVALRSYDVSAVTQLHGSDSMDVLPNVPEARECYVRAAMQQAVLYGLPGVYQYAVMSAQCAPASPGDRWAVNQFDHARLMADANYQQFRVPNVDTLYSNAWLDLTAGPVELELPQFGDRYYTFNFLDAHSNASNISSRTYPNGPARFLIVLPDWDGTVPSDVRVFRVSTPIMWVLLRIQVFGDSDLEKVRALQDHVQIRPLGSNDFRHDWPVVTSAEVEESWEKFLAAFDTVLRVNGVPSHESAYVRQFGALQVGVEVPFAPDRLDEFSTRGASRGFSDAMEILDKSRPLLGKKTDSGWTRVRDKGAHGTNYLARAIMNFVGLGANVVEENTSYNTYVDAEQVPLDGANANYRIRFDPTPPSRAFWSVTLYVARTGALYDAPEGRHSVASSTAELRYDQGSLTVDISTVRSPTMVNWLPCPAGEFFLVIRMYVPEEAALTGEWTPPPIHRVEDPVAPDGTLP
ncbi:DUF1254 domain-containing protein [Rhodococcus sp. WB9]|uniref:DUF1254 domain-containing protein n=1 Tax=Rhodococcus sp. WB9 TaxID=2594007 RepID=UPI00118565BB|nr:DUF1254 domain-containing protein [Rhodococcus sp. WB9]QDQ94281.1 DUF1254 domain-containing protein [Rhodococcus sp. WB9]